MEESVVLKYLKNNPNVTLKAVAPELKKSDRTVKRITKSLQEKGLLVRQNGKRNGIWVVSVPSNWNF